MGLKYGKLPRYARARRGDAAPQKLRVKIGGAHDLESFSLELQKMVAMLQDADVHKIRSCSLYLELLDNRDGLMALRDANGRPLETLDIPPAKAA